MFWVAAILLLLVLILYIISSIRFLARTANAVLGEGREDEALIVEFDFDTLERVLEGKTL